MTELMLQTVKLFAVSGGLRFRAVPLFRASSRHCCRLGNQSSSGRCTLGLQLPFLLLEALK